MKLFDFDTDKNWDYENGFYLTCENRRISKILAHYELYKMITGLPGHVMEFGVFKGASFVRFAAFRDSLESSDSRKIIGFDAFGAFPAQNFPDDDRVRRNHDEMAGHGIPQEELEKVLKHKHITNVELIKGDINQTLPRYLETNQALKISFIHVDVDVYQPTKVILETLFDRVVRGGVIAFDDYALIAGETRAVDEFFASKDLTIKKFPFCHTPSYVVKK